MKNKIEKFQLLIRSPILWVVLPTMSIIYIFFSIGQSLAILKAKK